MPKYACALILVAIAGGLQPAHAAESDRLVFGALRLGMSLDQARAALPDTRWTVTDEHYQTHRPYAIKGQGAVTLAGIPFDAQIGSRYLGAAVWELERDDTATVAAGCHERILSVIIELERRFGRFHHLAEVIDGEALVQIGTQSDAKVSFAERTHQVDAQKALRKNQEYWLVARHDASEDTDGVRVEARAHFEPARNHSCNLAVEMQGHEEPPAQLQTFDESRVLSRPTIGYRSSSLRAIGVPKEPLRFVVPCRIRAATGQIGSCVSGPSGAPIDPYRKLASEWALRFKLKVDNAQADDQRYFDIDVPVTMGPQDAPALDVSTGRLLDSKQLIVTRNPQGDVEDSYPKEMLSSKASADITILCKVQEDGSVLCDLMPGTSSPAQAFTDAAIRLCERLEVRTELRDGTSAVGGLLRRQVRFRPPESS